MPSSFCLYLVQGKYLGRFLSNKDGEITTQTTQELTAMNLQPFKYRHLGSFAYVGDNQAVLQLPIVGMFCVSTSEHQVQCLYVSMAT